MSKKPSVPDATGSASADSAPVREVCGLFDDHGRLEDAISRLEGSRFGWADTSVVRERDGGSDANAPELPGAVLTENDEQQVRTLGSGLAGAVAGMAAAGGGAVAGVQALGQGEMGRATDAESVTLAVRVDRPGETGRAEEITRGAGAARVWSRERPYY